MDPQTPPESPPQLPATTAAEPGPPAVQQQAIRAIRREKEAAIIQLSRAGATEAEIAGQLRAKVYYVRTVLRKHYRRAAREFVENDQGDRAKALLQLQSIQLELTMLLRKQFKLPTGPDGRPIADPDWELKVAESKGRAAERLVKVIERIAKLRGWDKPAPVDSGNLRPGDLLKLQLENATYEELAALEGVVEEIASRKAGHASGKDEGAPAGRLGDSAAVDPPAEDVQATL